MLDEPDIQAVSDDTADDIYFACAPIEELADHVKKKVDAWSRYLYARGLVIRYTRMLRAYYGLDPDAVSDRRSDSVVFEGQAGEMPGTVTNHVRSFGTSLLSMAAAERPALRVVAGNDDAVSFEQAEIGNDVLEYYTKRRLERLFYEGLEGSLCYGESWASALWEAGAGRFLGMTETVHPSDAKADARNMEALAAYEIELADHALASQGADDIIADAPEPPSLEEVRMVAVPKFEGDIVFRRHTPGEVARDPRVTDGTHKWLVIAYPANKWELAAHFPDFRDEILGAPVYPVRVDMERTSMDTYRDEWGDAYGGAQSDMIMVRRLLHEPSAACPKGREALFLGDMSVCLWASDFAYDELPVVEMVPIREQNHPVGYGWLWDLLVPQIVHDSAADTALANHDATGLNLIWAPPNDEDDGKVDIDDESAPGLKFIRTAEPPQIISGQLPNSTSMELAEKARRDMERLSGVNEYMRGAVPPSHTPAATLAHLNTAALMFTSPIQRAYMSGLEKMGNLIVQTLRRFATVPRIVEITGENSEPRVREYVGSDLSSIARVSIELANGALRTAAHREAAATEMLQQGLIRTPEEYFAIRSTGRLDTLEERPMTEAALMASENASLLRGELRDVLEYEDHPAHIRSHATYLLQPGVRNDPRARAAFEEHLQKHRMALMQMDPALAMVLNIQLPAPPAAAPPEGAEGQPAAGAPPPAAEQPQGPPGAA